MTNSPAPADESALAAPLELGRSVAEHYGFRSDAELTTFPFTENWTFRVHDDSGPGSIVLRIYRPEGKSFDEVRSELEWMSALYDEGLPVPAIVPTRDGMQLLQISTDPHSRPLFCVAFAWAPGCQPADEDLPLWFPRLGELTARFHAHARAWARPSWFTRVRWDVETTLGHRALWGPWEASVADPEERRQLRRLADVVVARLERFGDAPERFGLVHADLRLANLIVDGDRVTVLDFDDCGDSWYLYDLAATLTFNEGRPDVDELIASWVEAYRRVEPLSQEDEAEIKTFLMLRRLMLSAYVGLRSDIELARELIEGGFAAETCALAEPYLATNSGTRRVQP